MNRQIGRLKKLIAQVRGQVNRPVGLAIGYEQEDGTIEMDGQRLTQAEYDEQYPRCEDGSPRGLIVKFIDAPEGGTKN